MILKLLKEDLSRINKNVIACITILGICIVPCLYAWFNIAASWDPYENTENLKVAVVNLDEGYRGNIIDFEVNIGDKVTAELALNRQLDWNFTDIKDATKGINSGKYYAAIVIPKDFSDNMMSIFSDKSTKAKILYYLNEKKNAISPKITSKGATAIQKNINDVFVKTVYKSSIEALKSFSNIVNETGEDSISDNLANNLRKSSKNIAFQVNTLESIKGMITSIQALTDSTNSLMDSSSNQTKKAVELFKTTKEGLSSARNTADIVNSAIDEAINNTEKYYGQLANEINQSFENMGYNAFNFSNSFVGLSDDVYQVTNKFVNVRNRIEEINSKLPIETRALNSVISKLDQSIYNQQVLAEKLRGISTDTEIKYIDAQSTKNELLSLIDNNLNELVSLRSDYQRDLKEDINEVINMYNDINADFANLSDNLSKDGDRIRAITDKSSNNLNSVILSIDNSIKLINNSKDKLDSLINKIDKINSGEDNETITNLIDENPNVLSTFLSTPVKSETMKFYSIENYGSAMAPFYSVLALWVGGIIIVAIMKVNTPKSYYEKYGNIKHYQFYFSRLLLFLGIGIIQSLLISMGDLFYLKIQCINKPLFILAAVLSSIVYVTIIYTLTVSFGDIGKGISVILLVIQVSGSGGTFPIEVAPKFFQRIYDFLPFVHSMNAMRECVGGFYGNVYWDGIGKLLLFLIPAFLLGLVLRKPIIKLNDLFNEKLEETKIM